MMTTDIVNEIARLMAQRETGLKEHKTTKDLKASRSLPEPQERLTRTSAAKSYASADGSVSEMEKEQGMKVERLKALVGDGNYKMDPHMVNTNAERIAHTLV